MIDSWVTVGSFGWVGHGNEQRGHNYGSYDDT